MDSVLIVAHSGRMLAQALNTLGIKSIVIDCFADQDTQLYAEAVYTVVSLNIEHLNPLLEEVVLQHNLRFALYGSGIEGHLESLDYLAQHVRLLGNDGNTVKALLDKVYFFSVLAELDIPYPSVRFSAPRSNDMRWLIKPMQGQGGAGIQDYNRLFAENSSQQAVYWQRYQPGPQQSVLFMVDSDCVHVIGYNTQWSIAISVNQPFMFSGVVNGSALIESQKDRINVWLHKLAKVFKLQGLNSLDFIAFDQQLYVLEINPRPSASMQLYPACWLLRHVNVFSPELYVDQAGFKILRQGDIGKENMGYQLVYAPQDILILEAFAWPKWCVDLPKSGVLIGTAQPICSIIAHDQGVLQVRLLLQARQELLLYQLTQGI